MASDTVNESIFNAIIKSDEEKWNQERRDEERRNKEKKDLNKKAEFRISFGKKKPAYNYLDSDDELSVEEEWLWGTGNKVGNEKPSDVVRKDPVENSKKINAPERIFYAPSKDTWLPIKIEYSELEFSHSKVLFNNDNLIPEDIISKKS